jgi:PD-(D/E)XK nuclease superfamily
VSATAIGSFLADIEDRLAELVDDRDFHRIDQHLRRFNLFEAMGAVRGELRHSNFLSFILSPTRSHGIGSNFLLQFIRAAVAKQPPARRIELHPVRLTPA